MDKLIEVKNLSKKYRQYKKQAGLSGSIKNLFNRQYFDVLAVDDISFNIAEGEIVGFIGPNGAGKTTTLKMLSGLLYPSAGEVQVLGYTPSKRQAEFQKQFSLVMGNKSQLWWDLPPMESYLLNKEIYEVPKDKFDSTLKELASLLEIEDILTVQVRKLSLGQRMKTEIIAALLHSPKVMFLDEPTIGLDVVVQKRIREFFKMHNEKYKTTIILTSHYMDDVKELCKRVIIIDKGKIIYDGSIEDIIKKYAQNKYLSIVLHEQVKREDWEKFGDVVEYEELKVTLSVPRSEHAQIASQILTSFKVDDLDIKEIELEDVIRKIFGKN